MQADISAEQQARIASDNTLGIRIDGVETNLSNNYYTNSDVDSLMLLKADITYVDSQDLNFFNQASTLIQDLEDTVSNLETSVECVLVSTYCYTFVKTGFDIILQLFFISLSIISKYKIRISPDIIFIFLFNILPFVCFFNIIIFC